MKFAEVPEDIAKDVKIIARGRCLHVARDAQNGCTSHYARNASIAASSAGLIEDETLKEDLRSFAQANAAKHSGRSGLKVVSQRPAWADIDDPPPLSGGPK